MIVSSSVKIYNASHMKNLFAIKGLGVTVITLLSIINLAGAQTPEKRLEELKFVVPKSAPSANNYIASVRTGNLVFLSGKGPKDLNGSYVKGKLGKELTLADGKQAAMLVALAQIGELKTLLGDLSKVKRIVKVNGFVNSMAYFTDQSAVIDGYSDLMVAVFGEAGKHARTAVGVASLPLNMALEIEMVVEVQP